MPRFAANLSMMYQELDFLERFGAAAADGFKAVEFLFPYAYPAQQIRDALDAAGLQQVLFNAPPGDWASGERGIASLPGRESEFKESIALAIDYAKILGNRHIHVMAGLLRPDQDAEKHRAVYLRNLAYAALLASRAEMTILIEPINHRDMPGYFLNYQHDAHQICEELGNTSLQVQFDIYHCQIMEGDIATKLKRDLSRPTGGVGHIQIAGVPNRHEPSDGEVNYPYLLTLLDELGYAGWVGCEYRPKAGTSAGLGWLKPYF